MNDLIHSIYFLAFAIFTVLISIASLFMSISILREALEWRIDYLPTFGFLAYILVTLIITSPVIIVVVKSLHDVLEPYGFYGVLVLAGLDSILLILLKNADYRNNHVTQ